MKPSYEPYYRPDLALVHHLGFGFHADDCAPGSAHWWDEGALDLWAKAERVD